MKLEIQNLYHKSAKISQIAEHLQKREAKIQLKGLLGSSLPLVLEALFNKSDLPYLLIFQDKEEAAFAGYNRRGSKDSQLR